ncbi:hypothetical protein BH09BAC1_BH09BAC1_15660 [soil metagenome]
MMTSTAQTYKGYTISNNMITKIKIGGLLLAAMLSLSFSASATTHTITGNGNFNDTKLWANGYPGNVIFAGDTVMLSGNIELNIDVVVKGALIVKSQARLSGNKNLVIMDEGLLMNNGITIVEGITNRGMVFNKSILETRKDMINTGRVINNHSMIVGNILDNVGNISGNGGQLIANNKFVNSKGGQIQGNLDVCSASFMNVDGGSIDSTFVSFCGARIFSEVFLTASIRKDYVQLSLLNSENKKYQKYEIERSADGNAFTTIASVEGSSIEDATKAFRYQDSDLTASSKVYYRMKLTNTDGSVNMLPAIEIGSSTVAGR